MNNKEYLRKYYQKNKEKIKKAANQYYLENKEKSLKRVKKYNQNNKTKIQEYRKEYYIINKDKLNEKSKNYIKIKYNSDEFFKLKTNLRHRLYIALQKKNWNKNTNFSKYIGCSLKELKQHLETQFQSGMTWKNHGKWHIDHIIPLSSAKTEEEMYILCHYTNLQPLWAKDNLMKAAS